MPYGVKYTEPDELDALQKAEILFMMNPISFEKRVQVYSKVIRILQYYGYRRSNITGVHMLKDDEPNVIFFKNRFSIGALSDIPSHIQFAIYVALTHNLNPDVPTTYDFRTQIMDILSQTSVKVKRRVHKNLVKFLRWNGYVLDGKSDNMIHLYYPPLRDGTFNLENIPYHLQYALWGYFVLPKLKGQRMRMGVINAKKKSRAFQKRLQKLADEIEKQKQSQIQKLENIKLKQKELDEEEDAFESSGF